MSQLAEFLSQASEFRLGELPTEKRHPLTLELSDLAKNNLPEALRILREVELQAIRSLFSHFQEIALLESEIKRTLSSGARVFFCGCGATGRLSLSIETLWREQAQQSDQVFSFMAGGDYALIRSIEKFEDHFDFGARQLGDAGFTENDLLVASTEGGETPFVIGATEEALKLSTRSPFFLFCNPKSILLQTVARSKRVIENPRIHSMSFETGPMALAGSTRLQASSVLMLAAGAALFSYLDGVSAQQRIEEYLKILGGADFTSLAPIVEREAAVYSAGQLCVHQTENYGITVVTDTTERTPTFSLLPFESALEKQFRPSWTYLSVSSATNSHEAWQKMLHREPRALNWTGFAEKYGYECLLAFDLSHLAIARRQKKSTVFIYDVARVGDFIKLSLDQTKVFFPRPNFLLHEHLILKCALNFASTLVMGRLGRFSSNLMLYVRATNNKLIDRAVRYVQALLEDEGLKQISYTEICEEIFEILPTLKSDEPIVILTVDRLRKKWKRSE